MTRLLRVLLAGLFLWALTSVAFVSPVSAATSQVAMQNYAFSPASLTVHVGDTVTWTQHDTAPHNVVTTSAPVAISGPQLSQGQTWSYTFSQAGTYSYYCTVHPDMRAQVVVLAAATPAQHPVQQAPVAPVTSKPHATAAHPATSTPATAASSGAAAAPVTATTGGVPSAGAPTQVVAQQAATTTSSPTLDPMLLVAGVVTAVAVFCLLLLGSRQRQ
jgi:amicyanin